MWRTGRHVVVGVGSDGFLGMRSTWYISDRFAMTFAVSGIAGESGISKSALGDFAGTSNVFAMPVSVRWNPYQPKSGAGPVKPFVTAGIGPVFGNRYRFVHLTLVDSIGRRSSPRGHDRRGGWWRRRFPCRAFAVDRCERRLQLDGPLRARRRVPDRLQRRDGRGQRRPSVRKGQLGATSSRHSSLFSNQLYALSV